MIEEEQGFCEWYGLGPHRHDMTITGSIIGSTVHLPLPDTKDEHGWYKIEPGLFYWPDSDVGPELGIWRRYPTAYEMPAAPWITY
jgi:hypothetical protein